MKIFYSNFTEKIMNLISWWSNNSGALGDRVSVSVSVGVGVGWAIVHIDSFGLEGLWALQAVDSRLRGNDEKKKIFQKKEAKTLDRTAKPCKIHSTLNTQHSTLNTQHSTLNTQHSTLNTQHSTLNTRQ
jgi:hypothetical protein